MAADKARQGMVKMKQIGILVMCVIFVAASNGDSAPTYQGMVCTGWVEPEATAIANGNSEGEQLVVNTDLTTREKSQLYYARKEMEAAFRKEHATEEKILANHHLLFPLSPGSDWLRESPCGDTPMIRSDEYHITQFVPSNPKYPGNNTPIVAFNHADPAKCRSYFAEMRKRAVAAKYGADANDAYMP